MTKSDFPVVDEMSQFASFAEPTRRYIIEALALAAPHEKYILKGSLWDQAEQMARLDTYHSIPEVRERISRKDYKLETWSREFGALHRYAQFELQFAEMRDFPAFAFLYERLLGHPVRPWLLSIYLAAAGSPLLTEDAREEALAGLTSYDVAHCIIDTPPPRYFPNDIELPEAGTHP